MHLPFGIVRISMIEFFWEYVYFVFIINQSITSILVYILITTAKRSHSTGAMLGKADLTCYIM